MISRYIELFEKATQKINLDGRIALISTLLLTISIYQSNFNEFTSISIILFTLLFNKNSIYAILSSIPFLALFSASIVFFGGDARVLLSILALISVGSGILYGAGSKNVLAALMYFKLPKKIAFLIFLTLRMFQIYIRDLKNISEILSLSEYNKIRYYKKLLKTFVSIAILRSVAISETIYSREINFEVIIESEFETKWNDYVLFGFSLVTFILAFSNIPALFPFHR